MCAPTDAFLLLKPDILWHDVHAMTLPRLPDTFRFCGQLVLWLASAAFLVLFLPACASRSPKKPVLKVGILADSPPFVFAAPDSTPDKPRWTGIEPSLARQLARQLGMKARFVAVDSPTNLLPALRSGTVDILMTGLPIREDWRSTVEFSPPYLMAGMSILRSSRSPLMARDPLALSTPARLRDTPIRLALPADSPSASAYASAHLPLAQSVEVPDIPAGLMALLDLRADALLAPAPALLFHYRQLDFGAAQNLVFAPYLLDPVEIAWACRPGSTHIREAMREAVPRWTADGTLAGILAEFLPISARLSTSPLP